MKGLIFLFQRKIIVKLNSKTKFVLMCFIMKTKYQINLYLIMCISKILIELCLIKLKIRIKNTFVKVVYGVLAVKRYLNENKIDCLVINDKQNVKLEKGFISFKNYSIQIPVPFKIYADFECILKMLTVILLIVIFHTQKNIKIMFLVVLLINYCVLIISIVKNCFVQRKKCA